MPEQIVIVGAGQAASQAVDILRKRGYTGTLTLVGDEPVAPYQRPPLSKKYLAGLLARDRLLIRHDAFYEDHRVATHWGRTAVAVDRARRTVQLDNESSLTYDALLLATGSRPRRLNVPGHDLAGLHYLRTIDDVDRIRAELKGVNRAVIVGGGYIGLEATATLRDLGIAVTVLEMADRVMNRVVCPPVSRFYEAVHRKRGVELLLEARLERFVGDGEGRVGAVRCADGREIEADLVIVGVGVVPNEDLARDAGLTCANGIVVDEFCRTSDPQVFAAGDCTQHHNRHFDMSVRLESVDNAFEQANTAALNMLGVLTVHDKVPWFWSDQYDLKMIIVGLSQGHDEIVLRGEPGSDSFSACYLKAGELIAIESINQAKDQMAARKLIAARARPDRARLADPSIPLRDTV
ncbi:MAG: FAD-dependent oxidoreductase [Steroidobacteraceae bacterium]|nr:FAD-dependent oxidoreductase [Steroidobacteraceae bacterium]